MIIIINEGWDPFYVQNIKHKINKHPVMTVINGNGIQLVGMSEENMNVVRVHGAACLHAHVCVLTHLCRLPCRGWPLAGWWEFHRGVLRGSRLQSFSLGI